MADADADELAISFGSFGVVDTKETATDDMHVRISRRLLSCCLFLSFAVLLPLLSSRVLQAAEENQRAVPPLYKQYNLVCEL